MIDSVTIYSQINLYELGLKKSSVDCFNCMELFRNVFLRSFSPDLFFFQLHQFMINDFGLDNRGYFSLVAPVATISSTTATNFSSPATNF